LTIASDPDGFGQYLRREADLTRGADMHARVATFQHSDAEGIDKMLENMSGETEPPPGLEEAKGFMVFVDRDSAKSVGIIFFENEEALKRGDEVLNNMSPSDEAQAKRTSVEFYEVPIQMS
jgi:hypothetical protein